jgi:hypothetical protein
VGNGGTMSDPKSISQLRREAAQAAERRHLFPALRRMVTTWLSLPRYKDPGAARRLTEAIRTAQGGLQQELDWWAADLERVGQDIAARTAVAVGTAKEIE